MPEEPWQLDLSLRSGEIIVTFDGQRLSYEDLVAEIIEWAHVQGVHVPDLPYDGPGDPRLHELLTEIGVLHDQKQEDYGTDSDPFANVRQSEQWGIPAWVGAMVRLNDKVKRLQNFASRGVLANESAEDSMMDIAVYALIALILYREASTNATSASPEELAALSRGLADANAGRIARRQLRSDLDLEPEANDAD